MGQSINLEADLLAAMKARDAVKTAALRLLVASVKNAQIAKGKELTEEGKLAVLTKEAKKREEAMVMYQQANRQDLYDKENQELGIIKAYLPAQMSEADIIKVVGDLKASGQLGADFGLNMRAVMAKIKGQADGKLVAELVKQEL